MMGDARQAQRGAVEVPDRPAAATWGEMIQRLERGVDIDI